MKSRSYRNNNPGNIRNGAFAKRHGAVGEDAQGFAIWSTSAFGFRALLALLQTKSYAPLTIHDAVKRYAPPNENDSEAYVDFVVEQLDLNPATKMYELDKNTLAALAWSMVMHEGWDKD